MPNRPANRLAAEESPYLRQHARNPVDWFPWGEEAFALARAGQKPIFLSVGYSTCHWCHVMARESFEDEAVARLLNRDYVAVKVDREERPDVDRVYMAYVQAATGQGGWPMSVWLTPELKPFFGGTYFPPAEQWGRPGFATILDAVARAWRDEREKVRAEGERVAAALGALASGAGPGAGEYGDLVELATAAGLAVERCQKLLADEFDSVHGGFGGAPKFPRAAVFNFLHRRRALAPTAADTAAAAEQMAAVTLLRMAEGGIHDHVGGGFHRYSVDAEWRVPHFEKMLYDQAQLARCYLDAWLAGGDARFAAVARGILDYVRRDLADPAGGFHSAEDADSEVPEDAERTSEPIRESAGHAEGAFYLWTKDEVDRLLGADVARFCDCFEVEANGNVPPARDPHGEFRGRNILRQRRGWPADEPTGERLRNDLERLREARARRPRPGRDDKILAAWNGLMISALARGAQVLGERSHAEAATRAAEFLRRAMYDARAGTLRRSFCAGRAGYAGFAEDYAFVIEGLLDLYETTFEIRWLQWGADLQAKMDELFWDEAGGGYFSSTGDDPTILARLKEDYDGAEPAPTSVAAMNLLRLDGMLGGKGPSGTPRTEAAPGRTRTISHRERAWRCFAAFRARWESTPQALPQLLTALEFAGAPPRTVVLAGRPGADDFRALAGVAYRRWRPRRVILAADGGEGQRWLEERQPYLGDMVPRNGRATAYVCENLACQAPVTDPAELDRLLGALPPQRPPNPSPPP